MKKKKKKKEKKRGNHSYLGAVVGVDDEDASAKLSSFSPLTAAEPLLPLSACLPTCEGQPQPLLRVPHPLPPAARLTRPHGREDSFAIPLRVGDIIMGEETKKRDDN
jgi:hypothetical protein